MRRKAKSGMSRLLPLEGALHRLRHPEKEKQARRATALSWGSYFLLPALP
jgi:hypothetical protein